MGAMTQDHQHEGETGIPIGWARDLPDGRVELGWINDDGTKEITVIEDPEAPLGDAQREINQRPGVNRMNERTELLIERAKPGKFALRMRNKETGDSVVVSEGRANEVYDLKEAMERVARAAPGPTGL